MSAFRPAVRATTRLSPPRFLTNSSTRRFLNIESAPALATSSARVTGARNGHIEAPGFTLDLTMPKSLGGSGKAGTSNPEELFAAGYGACFQSAMAVSASLEGIKLPADFDKTSVVDTNVHLIGDLKKADLGIRVDMKVSVPGLSKEDAQRLVERTKKVCPYSRATQGNVVTNVEIV